MTTTEQSNTNKTYNKSLSVSLPKCTYVLGDVIFECFSYFAQLSKISNLVFLRFLCPFSHPLNYPTPSTVRIFHPHARKINFQADDSISPNPGWAQSAPETDFSSPQRSGRIQGIRGERGVSSEISLAHTRECHSPSATPPESYVKDSRAEKTAPTMQGYQKSLKTW